MDREIALLKERIRKEILERRKSLSPEEVEKASLKVVERIKELPSFKRAKTVMLYYPVRGEIDLRPLFEEVLKDPQKVLLLPKVTRDGEMLAVEVKPGVPLIKGVFGIPEPAGGRIVKAEKIDFVAVPGVAFDRRGCRLGMGKGFYDRFLPRVKGVKVGVAYDFQLIESVPCEEHDIPLDLIVTPSGIIERGG